MMFLSRFIILQSVVTRYLFVQKVVNGCKKYKNNVKEFMEQSKMKHHIEEIGTSISKYEEFAHYVEALVAYHKFYGGND